MHAFLVERVPANGLVSVYRALDKIFKLGEALKFVGIFENICIDVFKNMKNYRDNLRVIMFSRECLLK